MMVTLAEWMRPKGRMNCTDSLSLRQSSEDKARIKRRATGLTLDLGANAGAWFSASNFIHLVRDNVVTSLVDRAASGYLSPPDFWNRPDFWIKSRLTIDTAMSVRIAEVSIEHHESGFGIAKSQPRLSWRFAETDAKNWTQAAYEITIIRDGVEESYTAKSARSVLVPWPSRPLRSRESALIRVQAIGEDGTTTNWAEASLEVALLEPTDWSCSMISGPAQDPEAPKPPFRLRKMFSAKSTKNARLYATAFGIYEVTINGHRVGDQLLTPGWTSYDHHLNYQTYDVGRYIKVGENEIIAHVGEGWYAGRLGKTNRNVWGERPAFMGQLEVEGKVLCATDSTWSHLASHVLESEIYNGEVVDTNRLPTIDDALGPAEILPFPRAQLISSEAPPVRRVMEIKAIELITTVTGKTILDFGQNLVGHVRINSDLKQGLQLSFRHAEVLENGELGVRPLRTALARAILKLGGSTKGWEPKFTFFGFR
jgi:alpha-L-rhamnosidase